jgi:hypothetical protein
VKTTSTLALMAMIGLVGCAVPPSNQPPVDSKNTVSTGQVQLTLKKDVTSQTEVLEAFGAPNLVTLNSDGEEVWTYQRNATVTSASSSSTYGTIILFGGSTRTAGLEQSSRTMTLIIKFKEIGGVKRVSGFSSRSSSF